MKVGPEGFAYCYFSQPLTLLIDLFQKRSWKKDSWVDEDVTHS